MVANPNNSPDNNGNGENEPNEVQSELIKAFQSFLLQLQKLLEGESELMSLFFLQQADLDKLEKIKNDKKKQQAFEKMVSERQQRAMALFAILLSEGGDTSAAYNAITEKRSLQKKLRVLIEGEKTNKAIMEVIESFKKRIQEIAEQAGDDDTPPGKT